MRARESGRPRAGVVAEAFREAGLDPGRPYLAAGSEVVVFSHSYLLDLSHFNPQIEALSDRHRCIAFDHRGHGASERPREGYDMETLYEDAVAFLEAMSCGPVHFVGLSTGGFIGLHYSDLPPLGQAIRAGAAGGTISGA